MKTPVLASIAICSLLFTITRSPLLVRPARAVGLCPPAPAMTGRLPVTVRFGQTPVALAVADRTGRLFVLDPVRYVVTSHRLHTCAGTVTTLDLRTGAILRTAAVGLVPFSMAVDERRSRVFVISGGGMYDSLPGAVSMLDAGTGRLLKTTTLDRQPLGAVLAEAADHLFVLTWGPSGRSAGSGVQIIDVTTGLPIGAAHPPGLLMIREEPWASQIVADDRLNRVFLRTVDGVVALDARSGKVVNQLHNYRCAGRLFVNQSIDRVYAALPGSSHNGQGALCVLDAKTLKLAALVDYGPNAGAYLDAVDERASALLVREATYELTDTFKLVVRDARDASLIHPFPFTPGPVAVDEATGNIFFASDQKTPAVSVLTPRGWRIVRRQRVIGPMISMLAVAPRARRVIVVSSPVSRTSAVLTLLCADTHCHFGSY